MIPVHVDSSWHERFPGARMGLLEARGIPGLASHPVLEEARLSLEAELRAQYGCLDRKSLRELPVMRVFEAHYKPHGRTYHVLQQLESVTSKGRSIPSRLCAVTALFMAELKHGLVAAGHDLARIEPPLTLTASEGGERYVNLAGKECQVPSSDMTLRHAKGLLSTVLQGPDRDTPIGPDTRDALYAIYAPVGTPAGLLEAQLADLALFINRFAPDATVETTITPIENEPCARQ
jgi:DNA/RNA-binding domain of Phe-tRNA-synthetase-like protein